MPAGYRLESSRESTNFLHGVVMLELNLLNCSSRSE